jgi:hypothetical protein
MSKLNHLKSVIGTTVELSFGEYGSPNPVFISEIIDDHTILISWVISQSTQEVKINMITQIEGVVYALEASNNA